MKNGPDAANFVDGFVGDVDDGLHENPSSREAGVMVSLSDGEGIGHSDSAGCYRPIGRGGFLSTDYADLRRFLVGLGEFQLTLMIYREMR